ncbi:MAG: hypothetical protein EOM24_24840, partial [Chloroflexia bacterium]|nr:hypothetical protein [Chloroflexia bacterium]
DVFPAWSPVSDQIVFRSDRAGTNELFLVESDGRRVQRLTFDQADNTTPAWAPTGERIIFASNRSQSVLRRPGTRNYGIYSFDLASLTIEAILVNERSHEYPAWRPQQRPDLRP